ncbi:hypothetical protein K2173_026027 [Erythroxylum novogranatense]|uniref:Enoyl reductase (ER) domain-containing protein n=1 Tax=Erythroxylum novogranatense TaxID=1862640 RepID=A0AAV8TZV5_9ROSI|nr:hypothetical protein K2173_026027 [Erythroxylum novogranatense]
MADLSPEHENPKAAVGWAAGDQSGLLSPFKFSRRYYTVGICHSDLHLLKNEWGNSKYPLVPKILQISTICFSSFLQGVVIEVGNKVGKFKAGDKVGVGCIIGSCHPCDDCSNDLENYCPIVKFTYGSRYYDGTITYGGYSDSMVVDEHFAVHIPEHLPLDVSARLLCARISVYSPLKFYELDKPGMHIGVVGLGGLGHMAVKFAKAMGAKVTVISTSPKKMQEAIHHLGAYSFLISHDQEQMNKAMGTMDGIVDTVVVVHHLFPMIGLLKSHGKLVLVGAPDKPLELSLLLKVVGGSCIGGMKETQEMLYFAAQHDITADIEIIPIHYVNTGMERLVEGDVSYRFVIDIANTLKSSSL